ncbi:MAG: alpha/beta fold hydrolase [Planctomycetota bacterium]
MLLTAPPPALTPFRQGRFADLPAEPRLPHAFDRTEGLELLLPEGPFAGMRVHVRRYGEGPPLLLVHGLMTSSYSWRYVFEALGERFTCYAPDLPGNGRSERPLEVAYSPENLARWLACVQRALGIRGCPILANSMGGYLSLHLALADPAAMSRLIDLHSPGVIDHRMRALGAAFAVPGAEALARYLIRRRPLEWAHRNVHYFDESLKSLEEAREYGELLGSFSGAQCLVKYLKEALALGPMRELRRELEARRGGAGFPVPLLLLYAEQDPMVPPRFGRVFADLIPDARFAALQDASHFAHVDAVERFLPPVLEFLSE